MIVAQALAMEMRCPAGGGSARGLCLASRCMAWREVGGNGLGYCGMAGKPAGAVLDEMTSLEMVERFRAVVRQVTSPA